MRRTIRIALGENARDLGALRFDSQGAREAAVFEYDAAWVAAADRFAVDPSLPLVAGPQFHRRERGGSVFHGAIAAPRAREILRALAISVIHGLDPHTSADGAA